MAIETYKFLNEIGLTALATKLLTKANMRVDARIVSEVNENSSHKQTLSSKALYALLSTVNDDSSILDGRLDDHDTTLSEQSEFISALQESQDTQDGKLSDVESSLNTLTTKVGDLVHLNIETITGNINTVTNPQDDILYFQRDNESDTMWMLYIYQNNEWVDIGDTEVDLSVIWSKDETEELKEALGMHNVEAMDETTITSLVESAFTNTDVEV